jgi:hypothetical protein
MIGRGQVWQPASPFIDAHLMVLNERSATNVMWQPEFPMANENLAFQIRSSWAQFCRFLRFECFEK